MKGKKETNFPMRILMTDKRKKVNNTGLTFIICPHCGKKGLYKVRYAYERCRYCAFHRLLLPGQDF